MKKATLLLTLLFISTLGFSQNKTNKLNDEGNKDTLKTRIPLLIEGAEGVWAREFTKNTENTKNETLINQINKLELEYLTLKASQVQNDFANKYLTKPKTKEEVYKAYIVYLKNKITEESKKMETNGDNKWVHIDQRAGVIMKQDTLLEKDEKARSLSIEETTKSRTKALKKFNTAKKKQ